MEMDNILFFKLWKFGSKKIKRQNMTLEYILKILSPILLLRCTETFYKVPTFLFVIMKDTVLCDNNPKQDGPSLESSSYLNVSLSYLGPWDLGTLGPWNPWTLEPLDLGTLGPLSSSTTPSYFLLPPPTSSSYSSPLVWFGIGRWTFDLYIDV